MNKIKASEIKVMTKGSTDIGKGEGQLKFRKVIRTDRNFLCCKYSNDRSVIAAGTTLGTLELFNVHTYGRLWPRRLFEKSFDVSDKKWLPHGYPRRLGHFGEQQSQSAHGNYQ